MKPNANLEDYQNRESFLINYIEKQIEKKNHRFKIGTKEAYQDILHKLKYISEKDRILTSSYDPNVKVRFEEKVNEARFSGEALTNGKLPDGSISKGQWRNYWYIKDFYTEKE